METQNANIIFFNLEQNLDLIKGMANSIQEEKLKFHFNDKPLTEINLLLRSEPYAVIVFKVSSREDFVNSMAFLKTKKKLIRKGLVRPICILAIDNKKIEKLLDRENCTLLFEHELNQKTFNLKCKMTIKSLLAMLNQDQLKDMELVTRDHLEDMDENTYNKDFSDLIDKSNQSNESNIISLNLEERKKTKFGNLDYTSEFVEYIENSEHIGKLPLEEGKLKIKINELEKDDVHYSFENFEEDSLTLELHGEHDFVESENISIFVEFIFNKCRVEIELDGKVEVIEQVSNKNAFLTVELDQLETEKFEYFMGLYQKRQKNINDFMELAKGF